VREEPFNPLPGFAVVGILSMPFGILPLIEGVGFYLKPSGVNFAKTVPGQ